MSEAVQTLYNCVQTMSETGKLKIKRENLMNF